MVTLVEQLRDYFRSTSKEKLREEGKRIHSEFNYGPNAIRFIRETNKFIEPIYRHEIVETEIQPKIENSFDGNNSDYYLAA